MEIPRHWRLRAQRYRLEGSTCPTCRQLIFPPRSVCPYCKVPLAQIVGGALAVILTPTGLAGVESQAWYQITERIIK